MEESKWLFLKGKEDSVKKLKIFDVVIDHIVELEARSPSLLAADGME